MTDTKHSKIDITMVNEMIGNSPDEFIIASELRYFEQIEQVASKIQAQKQQCSILLVSGPSASSKTTTSKKIMEKLAQKGTHSVVVSLDDFFVNVEDAPHLENGDIDYESIRTIDIDTLRQCFTELLETKKANFPIFDFSKKSRSKLTRNIEINENTIVIVEGIHALNPLIVEGMDKDNFLKLYISPSSDYYIEDEIILSSRTIRFVRRLIRDYFYRANGIVSTMDMWVNVVKFEIVNIMPYKSWADFTIDSTIMYEACVYEYYLNRIVSTGELSGEYLKKMERLRAALSKFCTISYEMIPKDTVLHEFID